MAIVKDLAARRAAAERQGAAEQKKLQNWIETENQGAEFRCSECPSAYRQLRPCRMHILKCHGESTLAIWDEERDVQKRVEKIPMPKKQIDVDAIKRELKGALIRPPKIRGSRRSAAFSKEERKQE